MAPRNSVTNGYEDCVFDIPPGVRVVDLQDQPPPMIWAEVQGDGPQAPKLTQATIHWIFSTPPPLEEDANVIRTFVGQDNPIESLKQYAFAEVDGHPARSARLALAKRVFHVVSIQLVDLYGQRLAAIALRDSLNRTDLVLITRPQSLSDYATIPKVIFLSANLGLFGIGLLAEVKNSIYLVVSSGLGFEGDTVGAFCFVLPIVFGPFTALKFLEQNLDANGKKRFARVLSWIANPLALGVVGLFSWTIGMLHSDADVFGGGSASRTPPFWAFLGGEMVVLATMVTMLAFFVSKSLLAFFEYKSVPNAQFKETTDHLAQLNLAIAESETIRGQMISVAKRLQGERQSFFTKCLTTLRSQQNQLAAKRAQINSDPLEN